MLNARVTEEIVKDFVAGFACLLQIKQRALPSAHSFLLSPLYP
jgi:hypothetical protein